MSTDADRTLHAWLNPKWCGHKWSQIELLDGHDCRWHCVLCGVEGTFQRPAGHHPPAPSYADWRLLLAEDGPVAKLTPEQRAALAYRFTQINPAASTYRAFTELLGCMVTQDAPAAFRDELAALVKELGKGI